MAVNLSLRQIEAFRATMQAGTVVAAAQLLSVTQPAVSRLLALLELRIGFALFERRGRRLLPTAEAQQLFREVERLQLGVERLAHVALDIRMQRAGALRLAVLPAIAQWLAPRVATRFLAPRPGVRLFLDSLPSRQIAELVATHQYDVGVVEMPVLQSTLEIELIEGIETVAVLPAGHRLAAQTRISARDLAGERLVLLSHHSLQRHRLEDWFARRRVTPNIVVETPQSTIACALVAAGAGVTLVSRVAAGSYTGASGAVVIRRLSERITTDLALIYPVIGARAQLVDVFAQELRAEISALLHPPAPPSPIPPARATRPRRAPPHQEPSP
jgi:DNA-binding transcriptional LysR family regulator